MNVLEKNHLVSNSVFSVVYCTLSLVFLVSPFVYSLNLNISLIVLFNLLGFTLIAFMLARKLDIGLLIITGIAMCLAIVSGLYWSDLKVSFHPIIFFSSLLFVFIMTDAERKSACSVASWLIALVTICAIISFILSLYLEPQATYLTEGGRKLLWYYFSLGEFNSRGIFRPSGIYDEPGALSLVICSICTVRHLLRLNGKFTFILLAMGFVTLSAAHLIFSIFYFLSIRTNLAQKFSFFVLITLVAVIDVIVFNWTIFENLIARFVLIDTTGWKFFYQNNRIIAIQNALDVLANTDLEGILYGMGPGCLLGSDCSEGRPDFTPLSPLLIQGILLSWYYYTILFYMFIRVLINRSLYTVIGFIFLFTIRPSMHSLGYSFIVAFVFCVFTQIINKTQKEKMAGGN